MRPSLFAALFVLTPQLALAEAPDLKILSGIPKGDSSWKMDIISFQADAMPTDQVPKSITLCTNPLSGLSGTQGLQPGAGAAPDCKQTVLENGDKQAKVSTKCSSGPNTVATITRESAKVFRVRAEAEANGQRMKMDFRYRHQGACSNAATSPFGPGAVRGVEMSDAQCKQIKAQMAAMDPLKACGSLTGEAKAQCSAQMNQAVQMMKAACP
ncbi:MAG: hypothetical protein AAGD10_16165 [Myxococcota bacterium]